LHEVAQSLKKYGNSHHGKEIDLRLLSYNLNSDDSFPCANLIEIGKIDMPKLPTRHLTIDNGNGLGSSHENGSEMRVRIE